jgi:hypothetical protein
VETTRCTFRPFEGNGSEVSLRGGAYRSVGDVTKRCTFPCWVPTNKDRTNAEGIMHGRFAVGFFESVCKEKRTT